MKHFSTLCAAKLFLWMVSTTVSSPSLLSAQGWFWQNPLPQGHTLIDIRVIGEDSVIAVGSNGTIIRSTDNGASWKKQTSGTTVVLKSVFFIDADVGWIVGDIGTILHTDDGGTTWEAQASGITNHLESVFFTDSNRGWAVGHGGTILRTTNGGMNWTSQTSGTTVTLYSAFFIDHRTGWAVGSHIVLHTADGGATWVSINHNRQLHSVFFTDANTGWAVGEDPKNSKIFHTTDGGRNWIVQFDGGYNGVLNSVFFTDTSMGWAVGGSQHYWGYAGAIYRTTNGGTTWTLYPPGPPATFEYLHSVFFGDRLNGWVVGSYGTMLQTTNGGITWTGNGATSDELRSIFFIDANQGWAVGGAWSSIPVLTSTIILHTTNGGTTWSSQPTGLTEKLRSVVFADINTGWAVGEGGSILHTVDGGTTWTAQASLTGGIIHSVFFIDSATGWLVGGSERSVVRHTTNGGTTWTKQRAETVEWLYSVHFANENLGWTVGSEGTIFHTTNGGTRWLSQASGTATTLRSVFFTDASTGWIVGDGGTVLSTTNGGTTWIVQPSPTTSSLESVFMLDSSTGWIAVSNGTVLHTIDGGATWMVQPTPTGSLYSVFFLDASSGWVTGPGGIILHTTTGGRNTTLPLAPALISPPDVGYATSGNVMFLWSRSEPDVDRYWFELATDSTFVGASIDSTLTGTTTTVSDLQHNQTYWWRVRGHNTYGWGPFSEGWSFRVWPDIPAQPVLVSPADDTTGISVSPTLRWDSSNGSEAYTLQVSDIVDFTTLIVDQDSIESTSIEVTGLIHNTNYYWRVSASNQFGTSDWSEIRNFRTVMQRPVPWYPPNGGIGEGTTTSIIWRPVVGTPIGTLLHDIQVATDSALGNLMFNESTVDTFYQIGVLDSATTYFWHVRARDDASTGPWSETWSFTTILTNIVESDELPVEVTLSQNYPNPFNPSTVIRYGLPARSYVRLEVFNLLGQSVAILVDAEKDAGYHSSVLEGRGLARQTAGGLASGLYFYRLQARPLDHALSGGQVGNFVETKKLSLIK